MAKNHLKLGGTPLFARFLMCALIIFFVVPARGPKSGFIDPKLKFGSKKHGFVGSQVHSQKIYRRTHSGEGGGPGIHPEGRVHYLGWIRNHLG